MTAEPIDRPFTVPNLANRWKCSQGLVRKMIGRGELSSFRLGTLIRIPASEVAKIECRTASNDLGEGSPLSGEKTENAEGAHSTPKIDRARKPKHAAFGKQATVHRGPWPA